MFIINEVNINKVWWIIVRWKKLSDNRVVCYKCVVVFVDFVDDWNFDLMSWWEGVVN